MHTGTGRPSSPRDHRRKQQGRLAAAAALLLGGLSPAMAASPPMRPSVGCSVCRPVAAPLPVPVRRTEPLDEWTQSLPMSEPMTERPLAEPRLSPVPGGASRVAPPVDRETADVVIHIDPDTLATGPRHLTLDPESGYCVLRRTTDGRIAIELVRDGSRLPADSQPLASNAPEPRKLAIGNHPVPTAAQLDALRAAFAEQEQAGNLAEARQILDQYQRLAPNSSAAADMRLTWELARREAAAGKPPQVKPNGGPVVHRVGYPPQEARAMSDGVTPVTLSGPVDAPVWKGMADRKVTLQFTGVPLADALTYFRLTTGYDIRVDVPADLAPAEHPGLFLACRDLEVETALRAALGPFGLGYWIERGLIVVATPDQVRAVATRQAITATPVESHWTP